MEVWDAVGRRLGDGTVTAPGLVPYVGEKHYQRKHGKNAYYGQK